MNGAFLLRVGKRAGAPDRGPVAPFGVRQLGFSPAHRMDWSDASDAITLVAWHDGPAPEGGAWAEGGEGVAVAVGHLRWRDREWDAPAHWARSVLDGADRPVEHLHDELRGTFAAGHVTTAGDGWLITDPVGMRLLYWGEDEDALVVSSRAALVAAALAPPGATPERDVTGASWLAFFGVRVGESTGYAGVRVVAPGTRLRLRAGTATWEHTRPFLLPPGDELRSCTLGELAEVVHADVADALRASLSFSADRHVIRLTGGKDSRLVLAVAVRAGLAKEFTYETVGPPELLDVQIASELCERLELAHHTRFMGSAPAEPFAARFRSFVEATAGMVNGWDLARPHDAAELRLTGLFGEFLRWYRKVPEERWSMPGIAAELARTGFDRLTLVRRDVGDQLHEELLARLEHEPSPESHPLDKIHALYAGSRMRFTRMGSRLELAGPDDVLPAYSGTTMRASLALPAPDRQSELLFAEVMRVASDALVQHRFTDGGWDGRARAHLERVGVALGTDDPAAPRSKPVPLMGAIYAKGASPRMDLLAEAFGEASNPAWRVLDRAAALDGLLRYPSLTNRERYELFGAATAATWLSG